MLVCSLCVASMVSFASAPEVSCKLSNSKPWLRQQVIVLCEFYTQHSFMELKHENIRQDWLLTFKIPLSQYGTKRKGKQYYYHRFGWVVFPLRSGTRNLVLPKLKLNFGKYQLSMPLYQINTRALPVYLKPDVLVGQIQIKQKAAPAYWLRNHNLYSYQIDVLARGIPPQWLGNAQNWLKSSDMARYYLQRVKRQVKIDHTGLVTHLHVAAALSPHRTGSGVWHQSKVRYFDPLLSRWINRSIESTQWYSLPGYIYNLLLLLLLACGLWLTIIVIRYLLAFARLYWKLRTVQLKLNQVDTAGQARQLVRTSLMNCGINPYLPENQLYRRWKELYGDLPSLAKTLDELRLCTFAPQLESSGCSCTPLVQNFPLTGIRLTARLVLTMRKKNLQNITLSLDRLSSK